MNKTDPTVRHNEKLVQPKKKKVDDFTSLDSIGQKVVQYIHSERENLMKDIQEMNKMKRVTQERSGEKKLLQNNSGVENGVLEESISNRNEVASDTVKEQDSGKAGIENSLMTLKSENSEKGQAGQDQSVETNDSLESIALEVIDVYDCSTATSENSQSS